VTWNRLADAVFGERRAGGGEEAWPRGLWSSRSLTAKVYDLQVKGNSGPRVFYGSVANQLKQNLCDYFN